MSFWNNVNLEPKRAYRWIGQIELHNRGSRDVMGETVSSIESFVISNFSIPGLQVEQDSQKNGADGHITKTVKHVGFDNVSITIVDLENDDHNSMKKIFTWFNALGYDPRSHSLDWISELDADIITLVVTRLGSEGEAIEIIKFNGPKLANVSFSGLDYSNDEVSTVTLEFSIVGMSYENTLESIDPEAPRPTPGNTGNTGIAGGL